MLKPKFIQANTTTIDSRAVLLLAQPGMAFGGRVDEGQDLPGPLDEVVDPADRRLEQLAPDDRHPDHAGDRRDEVDRPEHLHPGQPRGEDARQHQRREHRRGHGEDEEDEDVAQRHPELDVASAEHPVLTEPVEVHQHLVAGLEHLVAGVGGVGAREVERHRPYVVVDADEGAAGAGGLPLEEADDEREQQRAGEEEEEADEVRRQEGESAERLLLGGARCRSGPPPGAAT